MFNKKLIVITGGSSGAGKELAFRLLAKGANLALFARDMKKLEAVKTELLEKAAPGQKVEIFSCDVSDPDAVNRTVAAVVDALGPPDVLINSAGILREGYFDDQDLDTFREVMNINFFGTLHCIKAALPYFRKRGSGWIVNISSMAGRMGVFGYSAYCSSKHAICGLTESLRAELKPERIRVQVVCPPEFEGPMVDELEKNRTPENRELVHTIPVLDVHTVVSEIIKGMEKGTYLIIPGRLTRVTERANRWFPGLGMTVVDSRLKKILKS